jgi:hypothetical protein
MANSGAEVLLSSVQEVFKETLFMSVTGHIEPSSLPGVTVEVLARAAVSYDPVDFDPLCLIEGKSVVLTVNGLESEHTCRLGIGPIAAIRSQIQVDLVTGEIFAVPPDGRSSDELNLQFLRLVANF